MSDITEEELRETAHCGLLSDSEAMAYAEEILRLRAERDALREKARALDRLEEWERSGVRALRYLGCSSPEAYTYHARIRDYSKRKSFCGQGLTPAAAINAALDKAEEEK